MAADQSYFNNRLRELSAIECYPHTFHPTILLSRFYSQYDNLQANEISESVEHVSGRVQIIRSMAIILSFTI